MWLSAIISYLAVECNKVLYLTGLIGSYLTVEINKVLSDWLNAIRSFLTFEGNKVLSDLVECNKEMYGP